MRSGGATGALRVRRRSAAVVVLAALSSLLALVGAAVPAAAWPASTVEFRGHGWGHGRGLSQWGSLGYAVDGWSTAQILEHYYSNTQAGTQPDADITVRLTDVDNEDLIVTSGQAFTVGATAIPANGAAQIHWDGSNWKVAQGGSCGGPWTNVATRARTEDVTVSVGADPGDDVNKMVVVCGSNRRHYRGAVRPILEGGTPRAVNVVRMEQYLRGVVPRESPASWGDVAGGKGMEALKAQAVAARAYAWAENRAAGLYKTCDTTSCQVYGGAGLNGERIEDRRSDAAVTATAGQVRLLNGAIARTEFSSSTGGWTAGGTFPAVVDDGDDVCLSPSVCNNRHDWVAQVDVAKLASNWPTTGPLQRAEVLTRNNLGAEGGRVLTARLVGSNGTANVTGTGVQAALGLNSDWWRVIDPTLNAPAVGIAGLRTGKGFVLTSTAGEAMSGGAAQTFGSMEGVKLNLPVVGVAGTPSGNGYWLVATDGGIFSFGDAVFRGSTGNVRLNKPIVGIAATPSGNGYWMVASDGGMFTFGDAGFFGSTGNVRLNKPIVGMTPTSTGKGYYLVASDGGIFTFGDATFRGSTGAVKLNQPIVGMTVDPQNRGYWFVASDGGVFSFPSDIFKGSAGGQQLPAPIVGLAATSTGDGYWLLGRGGTAYPFGDAA
jgi:SpoIID/LytB domain protein